MFQGRAVLLHQGWPTPPGPQQGVFRRGGSNHNHAGPHRSNHRLRGGGFSFHNHQTRWIHPPHSTRTKGKHSFELTSFHRLRSVRHTETVGYGLIWRDSQIKLNQKIQANSLKFDNLCMIIGYAEPELRINESNSILFKVLSISYIFSLFQYILVYSLHFPPPVY